MADPRSVAPGVAALGPVDNNGANELAGGLEVVSIITRSSAKRLGLAPGKDA